ncbi:MAG: cyclic nucleotide-binding domain-containing protein [Deltaproteobacteria bacterium]|nr:MAG: cyclic nucleotide-binding domain-containing protein [Deltaproteobacteria bacterium]
MWRKLGIEPGEGRVFAWGAFALFLLGWADVSLKNVSETFFLKRVGPEWLPLVFLANSVLLVATTGLLGRIAARKDRLWLLPRIFVGLAVMLLPLWFLVLAGVSEVFSLLVIASKQLTSLALLVFWIAMGDLLHGRQTKRLFAPMMAGVTLGTILGSFASQPLGRLLGIEGLLPVASVFMLLAALATLPLRKLRPRFDRAATPMAQRKRETQADGHGFTQLWSENPLFRMLFLGTLCSGLLGPMLYFQFSYVADLATSGAGGEDRLLAFYAQLRGWIGFGVLATQLLVAGKLYRRIGIPLAAALSPLIYLFGFLGLSVRMSLPAGVGAMAGVKLQDNAVYDPAVRVLYSLFPESIRPRASAFLEGPIKRGGGALGNVLTIAAIRLGSPAAVGFAALPIAAIWLGASLLLWRHYPRLLLAASASRSRYRDALEGAELLDPTTVRALQPELCSEDPARCRAAVDLVSEATPQVAVPALARAAADASDTARPILVAALDRQLERSIEDPIRSNEAVRSLESLLDRAAQLGERDRADVVQSYGRLAKGAAAVERLTGFLEDSNPAVRLAALAALHRCGAALPDAPDLDATLSRAILGDDPIAGRIAREEYRALLLCEGDASQWDDRIELLAAALRNENGRADVAEALAEVAVRHGSRAGCVGDRVIAVRDDENRRVRAALLRYVGYSERLEDADWLIDHLGSEHEEWAAAAREGLRALGPSSSDLLLRELTFGKRSKREGILEVIRELHVPPEVLRGLYERELDGVERDLTHARALANRPAFEVLEQRLEERVHEELHTALLFLAAIEGEERIAELGDRLETTRGRERQRAIVLEALESLLPAQEKARLMPLLEEDPSQAMPRTARRQAAAVTETLSQLREDPEELTRTIASGVSVAAGFEVEDHASVDAVEKMMHLRALPIFEGLTARQLMDLAGVVKEETLPKDAVVVQQGEYDDCLYLVVEGMIRIHRGETLLAEIGPGGFFGEIALLEGIARTATATTQSSSKLLRLERSELMHLIEELPAIAVTLLQTLSARIRTLTDRLDV